MCQHKYVVSSGSEKYLIHFLLNKPQGHISPAQNTLKGTYWNMNVKSARLWTYEWYVPVISFNTAICINQTKSHVRKYIWLPHSIIWLLCVSEWRGGNVCVFSYCMVCFFNFILCGESKKLCRHWVDYIAA